MQKLWAPWRGEFILGKKESGCIFCNRLKQKNDEKNLILLRGKSCFVILNRFPYNNGHLMVAPIRHIGKFEHHSGEGQSHKTQDDKDMGDAVSRGEALYVISLVNFCRFSFLLEMLVGARHP